MMRKLLWKDYRLNRQLLVLCAAILLAIYAVGAITEISATWPSLPAARQWGHMFASYGVVALYSATFISALLAGNAIASERADRTANFLAYLPPTKSRILFSKFVIAAGATTAVWAWAVVSVYRIARGLGVEGPDITGQVSPRLAALTCVLTFGVGWLASARFETAVMPVITAFASPVVVSFALLAVSVILGIPRFEVFEWYGAVCAWVGLVAFAAGTWIYLRRMEP
jgi:ABC-type transport system involved in multi-copper enzyme maturation permease subunit